MEQAEETAAKRLVAFQLQEEMRRLNMSQKELADRMQTSRSSVRRLLDPENDSLTIKSLLRAAKTLGRRVEIRLV